MNSRSPSSATAPQLRRAAELGEPLQRRVPRRTRLTRPIIFKSVGIAMEDIAAASLVYNLLSPASIPT